MSKKGLDDIVGIIHEDMEDRWGKGEWLEKRRITTFLNEQLALSTDPWLFWRENFLVAIFGDFGMPIEEIYLKLKDRPTE